MRVLFWGTPDFSIPSLKKLQDSEEHRIVSIVTQPDKPRGRGRKTSFSPVKELGITLSLPVLQPKTTQDDAFLETVGSLDPDINVIVAYGKILHKRILELPKHGSVCLHPSLLPRYRGAAPIQRTIMEGVRETGVTLFQMDEGMDTGPVLHTKYLTVAENDTFDTLSEKLSVLSALVLMEGLSLMRDGKASAEPQQGEVSIAPKVGKDETRIDWNDDASSIERRIRALCSRPGAYTLVDGKTLKIYRASIVTEEHSQEPGTIVRTSPDSILVATGKGMLDIKELQLEGRKRMSTDLFQRGHKLDAGMKLG